jgi:prephenate dehydrogenase
VRVPLIDADKAPPATPLFERVGVVGLGLIGGSIALAARRAWPGGLVIGVDRNDVLEEAMVRHAMDVAADDLGMLREAELIILAAPVDENLRLLDQLSNVVPGQAIVTDVGSTKREIVAAAVRMPDRLTFIGGHPLAGAARGGIGHASPDLFAGRPWILTPQADADGDAVRKLQAFVTAIGARPRVMEPASHDHLVAFLSHLPQLAATALMGVIGPAVGEDGLAMAGRGLLDTTRLASSPATVWTGICRSNADEIRAALDRLLEHLQCFRDGLTDETRIAEAFELAADWREKLVTARGTPRRPSAGPRGDADS